ncbi:MAG: cytochrome c biogenesis protein CcdA [Lachnospiraceae bacterium]|nr:cytochrome c biogenesis protein CcdA [Lachnospiraceae bacterium]
MTEILGILSQRLAGTMWLAPAVAVIAGVLTSVTPCSLSTLPLVIGIVGGTGERNTTKAFKLSFVFAFGTAITFTILGTVASLAGKLIGTSASWWYIVLGVLMVMMALQTWEIYNFIPATYLISRNKKSGYVGALIAGILGGIFSSPCSTPVLIALLAIVAGKGNLLWGILLLLCYALGHGILAIVAGTSVGFVNKLSKNKKYGVFSTVLKIGMGGIILIIAFYMFYLGF